MDFFLHSERLWHIAWVVPVIAILFFVAEARRKNALKKLLGAAHFSRQNGETVGVDVSHGKRLARFFFLLVCAILLVAAYARPAWKTEIIPYRNAGRDVVIALDLSKSMMSEDVKPSRLAHAKRFIADTTARMKGDRFALVAFAGDAFLSCPLTFDGVSFRLILDGEQIGSIPVGGTNIERALNVAATAFDSAENLGHYAIVLITDGGELTGATARAAEKLRAAKIPVVVVGVGDPAAGSPIPVPNESGRVEYMKDKSGDVVNTRLEEAPLRELAAKTGGIYIRSTLADMGDETAAEWLRRLTPGEQEEGVHAVPIERWSWFLIPAVVAFFLFLALGECRRNLRGLRASAFKILLKSSPAIAFVAVLSLSATPMFAQENSEEPEEKNLENASAEEIFNAGLEAQKNGAAELARKLYADALARGNARPETRTAIAQNLGAQIHEDARAEVSKAAGVLLENADEAQGSADSAEEKFKRAEEFYRDVLRSGEAEFSPGTAQNEQILLNDLKRLEDLKKQIEEQKKQQEQNKQQQNQEQQNQQNQDQQQKQQQDQNQGDGQEQQQNQQQSQQNSDEQNSQQQPQQSQSSQENSADNKDQNSGQNQDANSGDNSDNNSGDERDNNSDNRQQDLARDNANDNSADNNEQKDGGQRNLQSGEESGNETKRAAAARESSFDDAAAERVLREMRETEEGRREEILQKMRGEERQVDRDW